MHGRVHWAWNKWGTGMPAMTKAIVRNSVLTSFLGPKASNHLQCDLSSSLFLRVGFEPVTHLLDCKQYMSLIFLWCHSGLRAPCITLLSCLSSALGKKGWSTSHHLTEPCSSYCAAMCGSRKYSYPTPPWKTLWFALPPPPGFSFPGGLWWPPLPPGIIH